MKTIIIHKTKTTPEVIIDYHNSTLTIEGVSVPEDALEFYNNVLHELKRYKETESHVQFIIHLKELNTGSIKCLLTLFKEATLYENNFTKSEVDWLYPKGDKSLKESGQIFEHISRLKFNYRESD